MKIFATIVLFVVMNVSAFAQENESTWFDFWIGKWNATWKQPDGTFGKGTNVIDKTLDNIVIRENFSITEGSSKGYLGTSISVYNPQTKQWHQAYADNQSAYFNFIGERDGDKRIFKTERATINGKQRVKRMVFYNITKDSFTWDWEASEDGGKTWVLNWRIHYQRQ